MQPIIRCCDEFEVFESNRHAVASEAYNLKSMKKKKMLFNATVL